MRVDIKKASHVKKRNKEKVNYAKIARQYNGDYRTVKKYYNERDDTTTGRKARVVNKKTDGFESIIEEKFIKNKAPAIAIYNLLKVY